MSACWLCLFVAACAAAKDKQESERHGSSIHKAGSGMIYADSSDCNRVMKITDSGDGTTEFKCFRIGFIDSLALGKATDKKDLEAGTYFQYKVDKDWKLLVNGDSLSTVFFEPLVKKEGHRTEGILVFEVPVHSIADTLVYHDSFGSWGLQQLIISRTNN